MKVVKFFAIGGTILGVGSTFIFGTNNFLSSAMQKNKIEKSSVQESINSQVLEKSEEVLEIAEQDSVRDEEGEIKVGSPLYYDEDVWGETEKGRAAYQQRAEEKERRTWWLRGYI